jgi:hypothetical protein
VHRIIYADWLKKSPHTVQSKGQTDFRSSPIPNRRANTFDFIRNCFYRNVISALNRPAGFIMSIIGALILLFIGTK